METGLAWRPRRMGFFLAAMLLLVGAGQATPAPALKIGVVVTLSGPGAVLGQHVRDGFLLGVERLGGSLGGLSTEIVTVDDQLKPDVARAEVDKLIERDGVQFVVGPVFSNILQAIFKPVTESGAFLIGANAGTSTFAGKGCHPHFFSTSWQNDAIFEVMGAYANEAGLREVLVIVPNYQAGKDAVAGFKRTFKGKVVDELYSPMNQVDFSVELAKVSAAAPTAIFTFMPGGMGVNLVKQWAQSGLGERVRFLSTFTVDEATLPAQGDAAVGMLGATQWAPDLDNPANRAFVTAFEAKYGYVPAYYASQGYDAAFLIDSALRRTGGDLTDKVALRRAFEAADFTSVRGDFRYNRNHFPIQDYYLVTAVKRADGKYQTEVIRKVFDDHEDAYAAECRMPPAQ